MAASGHLRGAKMKQAVLIVDDMTDMLKFLARLIGGSISADIHTALSAATALDILADKKIGVVLADIRMPKMSGLEFLKKIKEQDANIVVIMMTAYGSIETAVESLKCGAYDYITKPFDEDKLVHMVVNALAHNELLVRNIDLERQIRDKKVLKGFIGQSQTIEILCKTIELVAKTDATVLITGETGTGKDLAAKMIHSLSPRTDKPLVAINCPAIPENILESELFGFRKGAFTGATHDKEGLFATAEGGTLFLDEIGDLSFALQAKLLRVLQEKEIKPLGENKNQKVDVRIIAATNQDLEKKRAAGQFRDDLFYRLNVVSIRTPALRDIPEDIPMIANNILAAGCRELSVNMKRFSETALRLLASRKWGGNVRELENEVKRVVIFSKNTIIEASDFNFDQKLPHRSTPVSFPADYREAKRQMLEDFDVRYITRLLELWNGNVTTAARAAGLERQSLQYLMRKHDIDSQQFRSGAR